MFKICLKYVFYKIYLNHFTNIAIDGHDKQFKPSYQISTVL